MSAVHSKPFPRGIKCLLPGLALACGCFGFELQDYEKVITRDAKTRSGVFTVHQIGDKYYYEIPVSELEKDFLWNTRISRTTLGVGAGGTLTADRVVRWHLNGNRVVLLDKNYSATADPRSPLAAAVAASNSDTIIMSFDVLAVGKNGEKVIEIGRLFTTDVAEFNVKQRLGATFLDGTRTWVERITPFPENVEAEATQTWTRTDAAQPGQMHTGNATVVVHHSMVKLPETPMRPRYFDDRVGFFPVFQYDYSRDETRAQNSIYISRWRMDKPIVYYIDSATPVKWRDWIRQGVESWLPAFEAAGFPDAIVVKMAPDPKDDPDFSPEDIRNSVIRWMTTPVENAFGPNIHDPRTGEILNADIEFNQNMLRLARLWYIAQIGPLDPRVRSLPLPDEITGEMIRYLIAHEVGHTLGLEHNYSASTVNRSSVMDYPPPVAKVAADGSIDLSDAYATGIGEWDKVSIKWGYEDFPAGTDEQGALNKTLMDAYSKGLRFLTDQDARPAGSSSSVAHLWDSGANAVDELNRVMQVRAAALKRFGENNIREGAPLATIEDSLVPVYLLHRYQVEAAAKLVGGMDYTFAVRGDGETPTKIVLPAEQRRALTAVLATLKPSALALPEPLLEMTAPRPPDYERGREHFKIHTSPAFDALAPAEAAAQQTLQFLFNPERAARLVEFHARDAANPGLEEVLDAIVAATWKAPHPEGYHGEISRVVDDVVLFELLGLAASERAPTEVRAIASLEADQLKRWLKGAKASETNAAQSAHLFYAAAQVEQFQKDPKKLDLPAPSEPPDGPPIGDDEDFDGWPLN
ncbi:MAG TPA: zinc-dependent metalloprotease [Bryobacteraceae bacterium]|nr:zinc-dependent metalloprotease [Bryobacteraceae bacterium]